MRISDWSSDVCSSDLRAELVPQTFERRLGKRVHGELRIEKARIEFDAAPGVVAQQGVGDQCRRFHDEAEIVRHLRGVRSEEHTSELQSLMRISYAVFCLKKKKKIRYIL